MESTGSNRTQTNDCIDTHWVFWRCHHTSSMNYIERQYNSMNDMPSAVSFVMKSDVHELCWKSMKHRELSVTRVVLPECYHVDSLWLMAQSARRNDGARGVLGVFGWRGFSRWCQWLLACGRPRGIIARGVKIGTVTTKIGLYRGSIRQKKLGDFRFFS